MEDCHSRGEDWLTSGVFGEQAAVERAALMRNHAAPGFIPLPSLSGAKQHEYSLTHAAQCAVLLSTAV